MINEEYSSYTIYQLASRIVYYLIGRSIIQLYELPMVWTNGGI